MSEVNIYTPRLLVAAINQVFAPKRFLLDTFFHHKIEHETEKVDIDIKRGNMDIAVYVHPLEKGNYVENTGFETKTVAPCYTKEIKDIRPGDTIKRLFGEDYSAPLSPKQREQRLLGERLFDLDTRIVRLEEVMAAQALVHGYVKVKGKRNNFQYDFGYELGRQKIILSGNKCWDKQGDPMYDIQDWSEKISERMGQAPSIIIGGIRAIRAIIDNPKIKERLDIRNFHVGEINIAQTEELRKQGVIYYGSLAPSYIPIYSYSGQYLNPVTNKVESLIPDDTVLLGCTNAGCTMLYGMIQNTYALAPMPRFPHSWAELDGSARYIQLESAPLPNPAQIDAFISARVLSN
ncbi:major capsid protein [Gilliamella apicola]|uniref:major capsid protein n=1 Tax=Gilliamella apicola TaxID=1196095 RepID=UPI003986A940